MKIEPIVLEARSALSAAADPAKAGPMAAYMKTDIPFYGVQKKGRTAILRSLVRSFPAISIDDYQSNTLALWAEPQREAKYLAIAYARSWNGFIGMESIPMYQDLITDGAWWDFVDEVAIQLVGQVLGNDRRLAEPVVRLWIGNDDLWLRRSSIICQIRHKELTDTRLLADACLQNVVDTDFFIRKAIGWALREYAKTNPDWVRTFVTANESEMAPLSIREAMKHLG